MDPHRGQQTPVLVSGQIQTPVVTGQVRTPVSSVVSVGGSPVSPVPHTDAPVLADTGYPAHASRKSYSPPTRATPVSRGPNSILSRSTPVQEQRPASVKDPRSTPLEPRLSQFIDGSSRQGSASPGDTINKSKVSEVSSGSTPARLGSPFWSPAGLAQSRTFEFPERDIPLNSETLTPYKHVTNLLIDKVTRDT